jgi:hypothetical protein
MTPSLNPEGTTMARNQIIGRLEKLEQRQPTLSYKGVDRIIWKGPEDDEALAEAERAVQASGRLLILRRLVSPIIKKGVVIRDDTRRPLGSSRCSKAK